MNIPPLNDSLFADGHSQVVSPAWVMFLRSIYDLYNDSLKYIDPAYTLFGKQAPAIPVEGMIAYADGTNWNPGGTGVGYYRYHSGGWVRIG